jgi:hypothetical protein
MHALVRLGVSPLLRRPPLGVTVHLCSQRTPRPCLRLLDHLVRPEKEERGNRDPEGLRRLEVDDQLELRGLLHGQVGRVGPLQDAIHIVTNGFSFLQTTQRV